MAEIRVSRVSADSNPPAAVRVAAVQAQSQTPTLAGVRVAQVAALNVSGGNIFLMVGGVWSPRRIRRMVGQEWT